MTFTQVLPDTALGLTPRSRIPLEYTGKGTPEYSRDVTQLTLLKDSSGCIRKSQAQWRHRTVERPVKNCVKFLADRWCLLGPASPELAGRQVKTLSPVIWCEAW